MTTRDTTIHDTTASDITFFTPLSAKYRIVTPPYRQFSPKIILQLVVTRIEARK